MNHIFVLGYKIKFDSIVGKYTIKSKKSFGWSHYDEIQDAIDAVEKHFFSLPQNHSAPEMFQALQKTLSVVGHRDSGVAKKTVKELIDLIAPVLAKAEGG